MSDQAGHDDLDLSAERTPEGFRGADILAALAVATFLAAIGLITFFVTTAFGG